jgi:FixJ family two-component response regulator
MPNEPGGAPRRIHVVDDEPEVLEALSVLLGSADFEAIGFASAEAFLTSDGEREAACLLLDNNLPGMSGLDLLRRMNANGSRASVIMLTGRGDVPTAVEAMKNGALHFLEKPFDPDALLVLVEEGFSRSSEKPQDSTFDPIAFRRALDELSEREREVYALMIEGTPTKIIAHRLSISIRTVEHHRASVMRKLNMRSLSHLIRAAMTLK